MPLTEPELLEIHPNTKLTREIIDRMNDVARTSSLGRDEAKALSLELQMSVDNANRFFLDTPSNRRLVPYKDVEGLTVQQVLNHAGDGINLRLQMGILLAGDFVRETTHTGTPRDEIFHANTVTGAASVALSYRKKDTEHKFMRSANKGAQLAFDGVGWVLTTPFKRLGPNQYYEGMFSELGPEELDGENETEEEEWEEEQ